MCNLIFCVFGVSYTMAIKNSFCSVDGKPLFTVCPKTQPTFPCLEPHSSKYCATDMEQELQLQHFDKCNALEDKMYRKIKENVENVLCGDVFGFVFKWLSNRSVLNALFVSPILLPRPTCKSPLCK